METFTSRDAILAKATHGKRPIETIEAAGGVWNIARLTLSEKDELEQTLAVDAKTGKAKSEQFRAVLLSLCLSDNEGRRLFSAADVGVLATLPDEMDEVVDHCMRINKLGKQQREQAEKNSGTTQSLSSGSGSASTGDAPSPNSASE